MTVSAARRAELRGGNPDYFRSPGQYEDRQMRATSTIPKGSTKPPVKKQDAKKGKPT